MYVPGRTGFGTMRDQLAGRLKKIRLIVGGYDLDDLAGGGMAETIDAVASAQLVDLFTWDDPVVDDRPQSSRTYQCDDPMCFAARRPGGDRRHTHTPQLMHASVRIRTGDMSLLRFVPSGTYVPLDPDFVLASGRSITIRYPPDRPDLAQKDFANLVALLEAANRDIAAHNEQVHDPVRRCIDERAAAASAACQAAHSTGWQVRRTGESPVAYRIQDRKRASSRPRRPPPTNEVDFQLDRRDYVEVLQCIASWADSAERQPGVAAGAGEDELRNALLATLKARFIDGTGEAFSVSGKTDLRILVRTAEGEVGPQVFHAECKIWDGPATVDDAVDQLVNKYSTRRDRLGVLVFFVVDRVNLDAVPQTAVERLINAHGGKELEAIAGWRVVRIPDPRQPDRRIELGVVTVNVQRHR